MNRPKQTDCRNEPTYPMHSEGSVVFAFKYPNMTCHLASIKCSIEEPHNIVNCGEFE